ncbi:MAG: DUF5615 family PIN-like protein [Phormidium sp.]
MRFLIDEDMPRSTGNLLQQYGHEAIDMRDIGLRSAEDSQVAEYAQSQGLCLITGDFDFADIRNYRPSEYAGIVVISVPGDCSAKFLLNLVESFLQQDEIVIQSPGKLIIVEPGRVRVRVD